MYGNSLVLSGLRASLRLCSSLEVIALDGTPTEVDLWAQDSDVIIFEMGATQPQPFYKQMQARPGLLLIGIDTETHAVLLSGQGARSITLDQLTRLMLSRDARNCQPP